jgi:elongation factor P
MQYLYTEGDRYCFMDNESFEQIYLTAEHLGEGKDFLQDNLNLKVIYYKDQPITIELPTFVELSVAHTEPGFKGDTASGGNKPATLDTGAVIQVPLFIEVGDRLKVDTRSGTYVERLK